MKKRTLAMLLALVLVISIVPFAAMAEGECTHSNEDGYTVTYVGNGKHTIACECGKELLTTWCSKGTDGKCTGCHRDMEAKPTEPSETTKPSEPEESKHEHTKSYTFNMEKTGSHYWFCNECETSGIEDCTFKDGECIYCGRHSDDYVEPTKPTEKPTEPKPTETEPKDDCTCTALDAYLTGKLKSNGDGTHSLYCEHGKSMNNTTDCEDKNNDGKCDDCGGAMKAETKPDTKPTEPECEHTYEYISYKSNNDGTHTINCKCGYSVVKDCIYNNGECIFCHYNKNAVECDCGLADGVKATYVGGGKHEITCKHGKVVNATWCTKGEDGCCIGCGHNMEEEEVTTPDDNTKPSTPTEGLDSVPKTGDNGSIIVMGAVAVLALFGGAYVFTKKRAF